MTVPTRPGDRIERRMPIGRVDFVISAGLRDAEKKEGWVQIVVEDRRSKASRRHHFHNIGDADWRDFLSSIDDGYVGDKLFGNGRFETDFGETCRRIRTAVDDMRRNDHLSLETAKEIRVLVRRSAEEFKDDPQRRDHEAAHVHALVEALAQRHGFDDVGGFVGKRTSRRFTRFMDQAWRPFAAALREELAAESDVEHPSPAL
jgi:hypothetical protein